MKRVRWWAWPLVAYRRWYWREMLRARRALEQDVHRYGGRVSWDPVYSSDLDGTSELSFRLPPPDVR